MHEILATQFEQEIASYQSAVLVYFFTPTCAPCHAFFPLLEEVALERQTLFETVKVNVAEQPELFMRLNFQAVPTLIFFDKGKPCKQITGAMSKRHLNRWLDLVLQACELQ